MNGSVTFHVRFKYLVEVEGKMPTRDPAPRAVTCRVLYGSRKYGFSFLISSSLIGRSALHSGALSYIAAL